MERVKVTQIEYDWALKQMTALGYIEIHNDGLMSLTDSGIDAAITLENRFSVQDKLLMMMFYAGISKGSEDD